MIFFDEGFEWRFGVEKKSGIYKVLSRETLEVVSNIDWDKWEKFDGVEDIILINEDV